MQQRSLILGGTKGLGLSLALESLHRGIAPVIVGRSLELVRRDERLKDVETCFADLEDPTWWEAIVPYQTEFVFWVAGQGAERPLSQQSAEAIKHLVDLHLTGPISILARYLDARLSDRGAGPRPLHLITIASTSSWRIRDNEAVYCTVKAGQAHFTRNIARELARDFPGSKTLLVNPGGLRTPNFWGTERDISGYMDTDRVAAIIWDRVLGQDVPFEELHILRDDLGTPIPELGQKAPEAPF